MTTPGRAAGNALEERIGLGESLEVQGIDKWFSATHALRQVSLKVAAGTVHAIVGENGAGKSTLMRILAGVTGAGDFDGTILIGGKPATFKGIVDAERAGIFLVPQELTTVPAITVAENLMLNREPGRFGIIDYKAMFVTAAQWIRTFRLDVSPTMTMQSLSVPQQQLVTIARAMMRGVTFLILDEPTATLADSETEMLFSRVREFRRLGVTTLYISHRLAEIRQIADRVTVMRDGRVVDDLDVKDAATTPRRIVRSMVGRDIAELYPKRDVPIGPVTFELKGFTVPNLVAGRRPYVTDLNLTVRSGEIVGLFGVVGSGTSQLARAAFGAWAGRVSGEVVVKGKPVSLLSPGRAIAAGMGYLTGDRKTSGLVLGRSIAENITLVALRRLSPHQVIDQRAEVRMVKDYLERFRIKATSIDQPVAELSGGTQQKVVAAKWMAAAPDVLILEEPTFGVDVGTKVEIYTLMGEIAAEGRALLLISSDLQEVIAMSDRVLAVHNGRLADSWDRASVSEEAVMHAATGGRRDE